MILPASIYPHKEPANAYFSVILHLDDDRTIVKNRELYGSDWELEVKRKDGKTLHISNYTLIDLLQNNNIDHKPLLEQFPEIFI